ncbi:MAG: hypothetical protein EXR81_06825 [Gammaproteobacteria bacterium]|nr:hypothetical protein [Gammaproteobacteria bacterium]
MSYWDQPLPSDSFHIGEGYQLLLSIMGSPDPSGMQLNGVGGGISSTSKVAVIKKSTYQGVDVDYLFGQVSLTEAKIAWDGSCGNLAAAVGLYALDANLVRPNPECVIPI